jgi:hypothetical protein
MTSSWVTTVVALVSGVGVPALDLRTDQDPSPFGRAGAADPACASLAAAVEMGNDDERHAERVAHDLRTLGNLAHAVEVPAVRPAEPEVERVEQDQPRGDRLDLLGEDRHTRDVGQVRGTRAHRDRQVLSLQSSAGADGAEAAHGKTPPR